MEFNIEQINRAKKLNVDLKELKFNCKNESVEKLKQQISLYQEAININNRNKREMQDNGLIKIYNMTLKEIDEALQEQEMCVLKLEQEIYMLNLEQGFEVKAVESEISPNFNIESKHKPYIREIEKQFKFCIQGGFFSSYIIQVEDNKSCTFIINEDRLNEIDKANFNWCKQFVGCICVFKLDHIRAYYIEGKSNFDNKIKIPNNVEIYNLAFQQLV